MSSAAILIALFACAGPSAPPRPPAQPPLIGFSFSPQLAEGLGLDPGKALHDLLWKLHPDLVRLPVYWSQSAPAPDALDFSSTDAMMGAVATYNTARASHHTRAVLVVGARNLVYPELYLPPWADAAGGLDIRNLSSSAAYLNYLEAAFSRYADSPLLYAWQVENEPLDSTNDSLGDIAMAGPSVAGEVQLLKLIDPVHPAVVTTFDSSNVALDKIATSRFSWFYQLLPGPRPVGHPQPALNLGDVLGLDVYVVTPSTRLAEVGASQRIGWKREALAYWLQRARRSSKQVWVTEMQAAPWTGQEGFTTANLEESAEEYSQTGVGVVLLWGVEAWLTSSDWMAAGRRAMAAMRVSPSGSRGT